MRENIFITGVNGFLGKYLSKRFSEEDYSIIGFDVQDKPVSSLDSYFSGNILDKDLLRRSMRTADYVIHLAAITAHKDIVENKFETFELNFLGTKNVLDCFTESNAKKFIYSSTGKVYGKIYSLPITEEHFTEPQNILGKSKLITERLIDFYAVENKSLVILRIFNVFGDHQSENFLIPTIRRQLAKSDKVVLGDIDVKRDYIHIDDVVEAFFLSVKKDSGKISFYNVSSGIPKSAKEMIFSLEKFRNRPIDLQVDPKLLRSDEFPIEYGSYEKIKKDFGWYPRISLESFLKEISSESCDSCRR